jgi:helicase
MGVVELSGEQAEGRDDLSVADLAELRWGVRPAAAIERFDLPGWSYEGAVDVVCPRCHGVLHTMRKPYESAGKTYRYVAVVCPVCPASFTLPDLGLKTHADLVARGRR